MRGGKKTKGSFPILTDSLCGWHSHLGLAEEEEEEEDKGLLGRSLPGSICTEQEMGITPSAVFMLEKWQRGCSGFPLLQTRAASTQMIRAGVKEKPEDTK